MKGEGTAPLACLSVGGNNIFSVRSVELLRRFREALGRIRDLGGVPLVCGILPRRNVPREWHSRTTAMNNWLTDH